MILLLPFQVMAQLPQECVEERLKTAEPTMTVGELEAECHGQLVQDYHREPVALQRLAMERRTEWNPFVITPYKQNYILPATYMREPNNEPYEPLADDILEHEEIKMRFGIEHQSNGQSQLLSRSWNRIYAQLLYAHKNYLIAFRPWYRIPEEEKDDPLQAKGDDNPDIDDYMGYFELHGVLEYNKLEFSVMARNNLRTEKNRGALELGMSFPLFNRLRGYIQYFNGYGESLIDYNYDMERIGLGVLITDLM